MDKAALYEKLVRELIRALEKSNIREYADLLASPRRLIWTSFLGGVFRGLGAAIGFSVLGALVLVLIGRLLGYAPG